MFFPLLVIIASVVQSQDCQIVYVNPSNSSNTPPAQSVTAVKPQKPQKTPVMSYGAPPTAETPQSNGTATKGVGTQLCTAYKSHKPDSRFTAKNAPTKGIVSDFNFGGLYTPPVDKIMNVRYYLVPNDSPESKCAGGGCWRCLESPQLRYSTGSTIESCHTNFAPANDFKHFMIAYKFHPNGIGPDGIQLYDVLSVSGDPKDKAIPNFKVVYSGIALYKFGTVNPGNTNKQLDRFNVAGDRPILNSVFFVKPCEGTVLQVNFEVNLPDFAPTPYSKGSINLYSIKPVVDIDETKFDYPLNV